jgi:hypothetical protein
MKNRETMNNDVAIRRGKSHLFCEDFGRFNRSFHGDNPKGDPYVIVTDGCSDPGSPDTNIGATVLALAAEHQLSQPWDSTQELYQRCEVRANEYRHMLKLDPRALDATLLIATQVMQLGKPFIRVSAYGDGVFAAKRKDGNLEVVNVSYPSGIPYYLNYNLDAGRKEYMLKVTDGNIPVVEDFLVTPDGKVSRTQRLADRGPHPLEIRTFDASLYDFVAIMSDGVHRVGHLHPNNTMYTLPFIEAVFHLMSFGKAIAGEFVERKMVLFEKYCKQNKFEFFDDLSIGVIYCG